MTKIETTQPGKDRQADRETYRQTDTLIHAPLYGLINLFVLLNMLYCCFQTTDITATLLFLLNFELIIASSPPPVGGRGGI